MLAWISDDMTNLLRYVKLLAHRLGLGSQRRNNDTEQTLASSSWWSS